MREDRHGKALQPNMLHEARHHALLLLRREHRRDIVDRLMREAIRADRGTWGQSKAPWGAYLPLAQCTMAISGNQWQSVAISDNQGTSPLRRGTMAAATISPVP